MTKLWANSGDSHFVEPEEAWKRLPPDMADRMPRSVRDPDGEYETVHVDGQSFRRKLPSIAQREFQRASSQSEGIRDLAVRLRDLDQEGIWGELVFPSLGMWNSSFRDPELVRAATRVSNDWAEDTIMRASPRLVPNCPGIDAVH